MSSGEFGRSFRWPFVGRVAFDTVLARAHRAEEELDRIRRDSAAQIEQAFRLSFKSVEQAQLAIADARAALRECVEMTKAAAHTVVAPELDVKAGQVSSIRDNDAQAAQRRRDASQGRNW